MARTIGSNLVHIKSQTMADDLFNIDSRWLDDCIDAYKNMLNVIAYVESQPEIAAEAPLLHQVLHSLTVLLQKLQGEYRPQTTPRGGVTTDDSGSQTIPCGGVSTDESGQCSMKESDGTGVHQSEVTGGSGENNMNQSIEIEILPTSPEILPTPIDILPTSPEIMPTSLPSSTEMRSRSTETLPESTKTTLPHTMIQPVSSLSMQKPPPFPGVIHYKDGNIVKCANIKILSTPAGTPSTDTLPSSYQTLLRSRMKENDGTGMQQTDVTDGSGQNSVNQSEGSSNGGDNNVHQSTEIPTPIEILPPPIEILPTSPEILPTPIVILPTSSDTLPRSTRMPLSPTETLSESAATTVTRTTIQADSSLSMPQIQKTPANIKSTPFPGVIHYKDGKVVKCPNIKILSSSSQTPPTDTLPSSPQTLLRSHMKENDGTGMQQIDVTDGSGQNSVNQSEGSSSCGENNVHQSKLLPTSAEILPPIETLPTPMEILPTPIVILPTSTYTLPSSNKMPLRPTETLPKKKKVPTATLR